MVSLWPRFAPKDINTNIPIAFNWEKSHSKLNSIFLMYFYLNAVKVHPMKYKNSILRQCKMMKDTHYYIPQLTWHKQLFKPSKLQYLSFTPATWCNSSYLASVRQCPKKTDRFLDSAVCVVLPQQRHRPLLRNVPSVILLAQALQLVSAAIVIHGRKMIFQIIHAYTMSSFPF